MRKIFLIISTLLIFFSSTVIQTKKAEAIAPAVGAGYAAGVGVYVIGGLLVAGGLAAVGMDAAGQDVERHAKYVWDRTSDGFKSGMSDAINAAQSAGATSIKLSQTMLDELAQNSELITDYLYDQVSFNEATTRGYSTWKDFTYYDSEKAFIGYNLPTSYMKLVQNGVEGWYFGVSLTWAGSGKYNWSSAFTPDGPANQTLYGIDSAAAEGYDAIRNSLALAIINNNLTEFNRIMASIGQSPITVKYVTETLDTPSIASGVFQQGFNDSIDKLRSGTKEIALSLDQFLAKSKTGESLTYDTDAATWKTPAGNAYTGDIDWTFPIPKGSTTYKTPTMSLDDVAVGDGTFTTDAPTTAPTTGDTTGILQGLWDWLKDILQKILDAIKALIGGIVSGVVSGLDWILQGIISAVNAVKDAILGLATAIANAIGAIFLPADGYFTNFFKEINNAWASKIPFIGQLKDFLSAVRDTVTGSQLPKIEVDLPERYGGRSMSIVDFSYFTEYRIWILNFIRFTAWFIFLKKLYARIPKVIGG